ncbi:hydrolase/acyltransferase [Phyllosticta citrichinensis]|uniref:Hydrolase/acyltransferase n=1 Tax=Phyllosticta citrichinensis TaxID=1130410 RepID=A0ABR1Y0D3_9PEZI
MWKLLYFWLGLCALAHSSPAVLERRQNPWETLPPTPAEVEGFVDTRFLVDGVYQWINQYNPSPQTPLVFLHGGLGDHRYWADVARLAIKAGYHVVLVDLRGHGRTDYLKDDKFTYELYIRNVFDLLNDRGLGPDYVMIGWSDGAASVLAGLIDPEIKRRIHKAFIFAGFQKPSDTNPTFSSTPIYKDFVNRCRNDYPTFGKRGGQNFDEFAGKVAELEENYPQFTDDQLRSIDGGRVAICGADRDEAVNLDVAPRLHDLIKYSTLTILKDVSHFAPVQNPQLVWDAILAFLKIPTAIE